MTVKYKVSDFAKDLNVSAKKVLDELAAMGSTGKKNSSTLEENELNYLLEKFSKDNSVASLDEYATFIKCLNRRFLHRIELFYFQPFEYILQTIHCFFHIFE